MTLQIKLCEDPPCFPCIRKSWIEHLLVVTVEPLKRRAKKAGAVEMVDDEEVPKLDEKNHNAKEHNEDHIHSLPRKKAKTSKKVTTEAPRQPLGGKDVNRK
jgi:hypothetical protein